MTPKSCRAALEEPHLLDHHTIPRGDGAGLDAQFTATYNAKAGKFPIGGVKKLAR